jgi:hypothetical protein
MLWALVALVAIGAAAGTAMAIAGVGTSTITTLMSLLVVPVLAALIGAKQGETGAAVQQVKEQTNGNLSRMLDIIERQGAQLAAATPPYTPLAQLPTPAPGPVDEPQAHTS